jgi:hypothetical protein
VFSFALTFLVVACITKMKPFAHEHNGTGVDCHGTTGPYAKKASLASKHPIERLVGTLFNTSVENTVEKYGSNLVTTSTRDASTPCTELVAGTLVVS